MFAVFCLFFEEEPIAGRPYLERMLSATDAKSLIDLGEILRRTRGRCKGTAASWALGEATAEEEKAVKAARHTAAVVSFGGMDCWDGGG